MCRELNTQGGKTKGFPTKGKLVGQRFYELCGLGAGYGAIRNQGVEGGERHDD